jgi:ligand-binding sensor domain-containing protein
MPEKIPDAAISENEIACTSDANIQNALPVKWRGHMHTVKFLFAAALCGVSFPLQLLAQYPDQTDFNFASHIKAITTDDTRIWAACDGMLVSIDKSTGSKTVLTKAATGLAMEKVTTIQCDRSGALWLGCSGHPNVIRYSQGTFTAFDASVFSSVHCLLQRKNGDILAGTECGVARLTGTSWEMLVVKGNGLPHDTVSCLAEDTAKNLWIACGYWALPGTSCCDPQRGILASFDGTALRVYDSTICPYLATAVSYLSCDKKGNLWFSSVQGVGSFNGGQWRTFSEQNSPLKQNWGKIVPQPMSLACAADGNVWFNPQRDSLTLIRFDGQNWLPIVPANPAVLDDRARLLLPQPDSTLWYCTYRTLFSLKGDSEKTFYPDVASALWGPKCITETKTRGIWVGTSNGLAVYQQSQWLAVNSSNSNLPRCAINALYTDRGDTTWALTDSGIYSTSDGLSWSRFPFKDSVTLLGSQQVRNPVGSFLKDSKGRLWIGSLAGLTRITAVDTTLFLQQDMSRKGIADVKCIFEDTRGNIWAGCMWSVSRYDGTAWKNYGREDGSLPLGNSRVNKIMEASDGTIWVGEENENRLALYSSAEDKFIIYPASNMQALGSASISCVTEDHTKAFWFGSGSAGILHQSGERADHLTKSNSSLLSDGITFIMEDRSRRVWVGAGEGIVVFDNDQSAIRTSPIAGRKADTRLFSAVEDRRNGTVTIRFSFGGNPAVFQILSIDGAVVWLKTVSGLRAGTHSIAWPGTTASGKPASAGCYIIRSMCRGVSGSCVVTLVR